MKDFNMFLDNISNIEQKQRTAEILNYIYESFPQLKAEIKWGQAMFTHHGTFIIGFSIAKAHIAVAPEPEVINIFEKEINDAGYSHTKGLFKIKWSDTVNFNLLHKITAYNIDSKKDITKFWR